MRSDYKNSNRNRKKKRPKKQNNLRTLIICIFIALLLLIALIVLAMTRFHSELPEIIEKEITSFIENLDQPVEKETDKETELPETEPETQMVKPDGNMNPMEDQIYSFMQGPKAWNMKADFSGAWCNMVLAGQEFSIFGCGLCVLANIYSTITPYECSPVDMFHYAKEVSEYSPVSGFGAIDWPYMQQTLKSAGIRSSLHRKNASYEKFQKSIAGATTAIVLVCSSNDDTYWHDTPGHYVNIWRYNPEDDTVFLNDSGNPAHNRQRIPLRYIYDALKTSNAYQYQLITGYTEDNNTWKHDGIDIEWKKPKYYKYYDM